METQALHDRIARYLAEQRDIRLGILFGSVASGRAGYDSDLDIAVLAEQPLSAQRRQALIAGLARLSGRAVDLVDLATAGPAIARSALTHGQVLIGHDSPVYPQQISRMLIDSNDFLPYRDRILRQRRNAWIQQ